MCIVVWLSLFCKSRRKRLSDKVPYPIILDLLDKVKQESEKLKAYPTDTSLEIKIKFLKKN